MRAGGQDNCSTHVLGFECLPVNDAMAILQTRTFTVEAVSNDHVFPEY